METPKLLTDDMDIRDTELSMYHGNNGDYYICLKETKRGNVVKLDTRISMSGGNATPEIRQAVSSLFKALLGQNDDTGESGLHLQNVSVPKGTVCYYKPCLDQYNGKCLHSGKYPTCKNKQTAR
jgi:hypothetical protein